MIKYENISKKYGSLLAVNNLNLTIAKGEIFGFLGPNGAGKTTTIKMTTGLLAPTIGRVLVDNIDIQKNPEAAKMMMGYIPDTPYIYDKLTAWEFVALVGGLYGMDTKSVRAKAEKYFERFNIGDWSNDRAEEYSHGMRQKVVIAASLIHDPKVIIVDEPMVGLDPQSQKIVKNIFKEKAAEGCTIFMSTHTLSIANEICDRVGIINKSNLVMLERVDKLKEKFNENNNDLEELFLELTQKV
jgi:ABC-2 type transport system ATP-binding protein